MELNFLNFQFFQENQKTVQLLLELIFKKIKLFFSFLNTNLFYLIIREIPKLLKRFTNRNFIWSLQNTANLQFFYSNKIKRVKILRFGITLTIFLKNLIHFQFIINLKSCSTWRVLHFWIKFSKRYLILKEIMMQSAVLTANSASSILKILKGFE